MEQNGQGSSIERLKTKLSQMFRLDQEDLDFGIFRIMNQKRNEITAFLDKQLIPQIELALTDQQIDQRKEIEEELDKHVAMLKDDGMDPEESIKTKELRQKISNLTDTETVKIEIFNHMYNFFNRYFEKGDFISKRRHKDGTYLLPYNGEEVKLSWANSDQYFVKTTPSLSNYSFKTPNSKRVSFEIRSGCTELNSNKNSNGKDRLLELMEKPAEIRNNELVILFEYKISDEKHSTQNSKNAGIVEALKNLDAYDDYMLGVEHASENGKKQTVLERHLEIFTTNHDFDYFIHENLGDFLKSELDNYIRCEILDLDLFNDMTRRRAIELFSTVSLVRNIATKIISFLSQFENFQKRMWLKKKFVLGAEYCVTLDHIIGSREEDELLQAIVSNEAQLKEWERLYSFSLDGNDDKVSIVKKNDKLSVNTRHFDRKFKFKLLGIFDDLDSKVSGLVVNSENFQALNLLQSKYSKKVDSIYIDPPYNTGKSEIIYKNGYRSSSWLSMMRHRLELGRKLLKSDGLQCTTIDDVEFHKLRELISVIFGEENIMGVSVIRHNPAGRATFKGFAVAHEYGIFSGMTESATIGRLTRNKEQEERYNKTDERGAFEWVNFRRSGGLRSDSPRMFYPIFIKGDSIRFPKFQTDSDELNSVDEPDMIWDEKNKEWKLLKEKMADEVIVYPVNDAGLERRWRFSIERALREPEDEFSVRKNSSGQPYVYMKYRVSEEGRLPLTIWDDAKYSATDHGTKYLNSMFDTPVFTYPKSIWAVIDTLTVLKTGVDSLVLDYFAGSGTTADATIRLNREDGGNRKFILVEMGTYVENMTIPRVLKSAYSENWKDGNPTTQSGISHVLKCISLEQYEDTINNIDFVSSKRKNDLFDQNPDFYEQYVLGYMFNAESLESPSFLNVDKFVNPFDYKLQAVIDDAIETVSIDLIESFNYLLGLHVLHVEEHSNGIVTVAGRNQSGEEHLIIWRNCTEIDNNKLNEWFKDFSKSNDFSFKIVYVNCDCNLERLKTPEENWIVKDIESEFKSLMFSQMEIQGAGLS